MPAAWNHSATSRFSAAAPEMKNRTRPPKRSRILLNTSLSNEPVLHLERRRDRLALALEPVDLEPDGERPVEDLLLRAALGLRCIVTMRPCAFSKMRGAAPMKVGFTTARFSMILSTRPSTAVGEADRELGAQQHLAERVRHRQPQELQVVLGQDVLGLDRLALVGPRAVPQPHTLGPAGGAGGVDQRGQLVRLDGRRRAPRHGGRVLGEEVARPASRGRRGRSPSRRRSCRRR